MNKRKPQLLIGTIAILTGLLSGCASPSAGGSDAEASSGSNSKSSGTAQSDGKTLRLLIPNYYNETEKKQWENITGKFEELHPDIDVELTTGNVQVESGKLTTMLQSGVTPPDAILMNGGPGRVKVLSDVNLIKPLNEFYAANQWDTKLKPFAYSLVSGSDKIYELPYTIDAIMVFYNKDLFAKAGAAVPKTEAEWAETLKKLKSAGISPLTVGARNGYAIGWLYSNIMESAAGRPAVEKLLYGDGKWNDAPIVNAAKTLSDWVKEGYISKESVTLTSDDSKFAFLSKKAAMTVAGTPLISDIVDQKLEDSVGAFTLPSFTGQSAKPTGGVGLTWVVPAKAEHTDLAETWMNFVLSTEYSSVVFSDPAYNLILSSKSSLDTQPAGQILAEAVKSTETDSAYNPSVFIGVEAKEAYYQNLQALVGGLVSPEQAMDNIEAGAAKDREDGFKLTKK